jgi:hypothetical protein
LNPVIEVPSLIVNLLEQIDELLVAGVVKTQYEFQPLTIAAELIDDDALITISSPVTSANVIKEDIIACKVGSLTALLFAWPHPHAELSGAIKVTPYSFETSSINAVEREGLGRFGQGWVGR